MVYTLLQLKELFSPVFDRYGIRKAILFGSYSKGLATAKSDVDLLVDSNLRGLKFVGLLEELKEVVGKEIDLLDVTHINAGSPIEREIRKTGTVIYEK